MDSRLDSDHTSIAPQRLKRPWAVQDDDDDDAASMASATKKLCRGNRMKSRRLDVIVSPKYTNLCMAGNIEEFKQAFIHCVECHYQAYTTGRVLHRGLGDNNLMLWHPELDGPAGDEPASCCASGNTPQTVSLSTQDDALDQPSVLGILNDWDIASELTDKGAFHRTGTLSFMATDLLVTPAPAHYYRHDLESFFYILIWAAVHYDLKKKTRRPTPQLLALWGDQTQALTSKLSMFGPGSAGIASKEAIFKLVGREFQEIRAQWISPLHELFHTAFQSIPRRPNHPEFSKYDHTTCNGQITFETFMAAIGMKPRPVETT